MSDFFDDGGQIIWRPTPDYIENAHLTRFMRAHNLHSFDELMRRSTSDIAWFTDAVLKYMDIHFYQPYTRVVDLSRGFPWPRWYIDGKW